MTTLEEMESQLAELQAKVAAERDRVKQEMLETIRSMIAAGTLTAAEVRAILPPAYPNRKKPGRKPKNPPQQEAA